MKLQNTKFNLAYNEPVQDMDGGSICISAELYSATKAAELISLHIGQTISGLELSREFAHFHGEFYEDEFINTWWRSFSNDGGDTPMTDQYANKKGSKPLWVYR